MKITPREYEDAEDITAEIEPEIEELSEDPEPAQSAATDAESSVATPAEKTKAPKGKKPAVNLDDIDDFRKFKSETDRKKAEADARIADLQRQLEDRELAVRHAEVDRRRRELEQALSSSYEPSEQAAAAKELGRIEAYATFEQIQAWERQKQADIKKAGLDPADTRFSKQYQGETGLHQFRADLAEAKAERIAAEAAELRKAADPKNIAALVRAEMAKARVAQGFDDVDLGSDTPPVGSDDQFQADVLKFQHGQMTGAAFREKWKGRK